MAPAAAVPEPVAHTAAAAEPVGVAAAAGRSQA
jgi:hypothetical protein